VRRFRFSPALPKAPFTAADVVLLLGVASLAYAGVRLAFGAPPVIAGPEISTSPGALPWYAFLSLARMSVAYLLSLAFSLPYGALAASRPALRKVLLPLLDVLQSIPILSFLPVVLLGLASVLPERAASELAAIILIFTSQAWNLTFSFYQSMTTMPLELREASSIFRLGRWLRFSTLHLPFAALGLIWNSIMSWAGGWFFLMAAEIFTVGPRDFRLPGLGSYLQTAANEGNGRAIAYGLVTLVGIIVAMDQLVWRPLLAWADKFKIEMTESDEPPTSWALDALSGSRLARAFRTNVAAPCVERIERWITGPLDAPPRPEKGPARASVAAKVGLAIVVLAIGYAAFRATGMLAGVSGADWRRLALGLLATAARVSVSLLLALAWTIPVGVAIGQSRRLALVLQPLVQVVASIPATAIFPIIVVALLRAPGGLDIAAVLLMLLGTQWYLLFNVIAGTSAIPVDLRYTSDLLQLKRLERFKTLVLPALFPYIITGAITASGGAWNASIVAEHVVVGGKRFATLGIGSIIAEATAQGNYPLLLAATLLLILCVSAVNRFVWRRLYRLAEERYRLD
jgi:NitT/TauT family transport system permease protein